MKDQDENEAERDEEDTDDRDSDDEVESERAPEPKTKASASKARATASSSKAAPVKASGGMGSAQVGLIAILALAAGGAGGWFGHIAQAKAALRADSPAPTTESGTCGQWAQKVCGSAGKQSAACAQAKGAAELLTPLTCDAGLLAMPATLAKLKTMRSGCDKLVTKLCGDLPPGSQTCAMVKERTPSFPSERCTEMLEHYDEVIGQLKQIEQAQAGMQMGGPGGPGMGGPGGPGMGAPGGPVVVSPQ
jgi:hypothetical protein